jgi:hypothetical protein
LVFSNGETTLYEFDIQTSSLYRLDTEKTREHDCPLTGFDFNVKL